MYQETVIIEIESNTWPGLFQALGYAREAKKREPVIKRGRIGSRAFFRSSPLTESLEQAIHGQTECSTHISIQYNKQK